MLSPIHVFLASAPLAVSVPAGVERQFDPGPRLDLLMVQTTFGDEKTENVGQGAPSGPGSYHRIGREHPD